MTWELSKEYESFKEYILKIAQEKGCHPSQLTDLKEWPEFIW